MIVRKSLVLLVAIFASNFAFADEGMYPVSEISRLDLPSHGLTMQPADIFNPDQVCLVDGICKVNGCTGSFVSPRGLIITNHHCAYRAIQNASSSDRDYLQDGFQAKVMTDEIPAPGYTVRITESFKEVSQQVLTAIDDSMSFEERTKAIEKRQKELEKKAESDHPGARAEVAEMFAGKTYVLFLYTYIKDVRLVFAPPASIGVFGGDVDNWEWPRHTGDFTFMRAYVAPDGSTAEYSPNNVPYQPKRFIQVNANGVDENDYVMLVGYPGRTSRHKTAEFLRYEQDVRLPYIVDLYHWQIDVMKEASKQDRTVALKHSSRIKSLENTEKRSRGQLKGLVRKKIVETRVQREAELQKFIDADPDRKAKYGYLLVDIASVYNEMKANSKQLDQINLTSACRLLSFAYTIVDGSHERQKEDLLRETPYMDRNFELTQRRLLLGWKDLDVETDKKMLAGMLKRISGDDQIDSGWLDKFYQSTKLTDAAFIESCLEQTPDQLKGLNDPVLDYVFELYPRRMEMRAESKARVGKLAQLYGELVTVKQQFLKQNFVPDANATLRITFGHVKGYSPEDAVYKSPITTLGGAIDKATGVDPFVMPQKVVDMHSQRQFGRFAHAGLKDIPTAILYDTDTTGGNSGSPILDANGQLVGVNFDRAFEATINDFAWNESYSRSIGVDIRYALWITGDVYGAKHLLKEMSVE